MAEEPVLHGVDERGVATVTLNRPEVNNAYDGRLIDGLHRALDTLGSSRGLRALVVRGSGRYFQAGADLEWLASVAERDEAENLRVSQATGEVVARLDALAIPTLALVQGGCFGGGTGILAACDVVVAEENAVFAISEVRWGLIASVILPQLVSAIGPRALRRYAVTGERFDAREALRIGLVHELCPRGDLAARGFHVLEEMLRTAPEVTAATKRRLREIARVEPSPELVAELVAEHARARQAAEARQGLAAFRKSQAPPWAPGQAT